MRRMLPFLAAMSLSACAGHSLSYGRGAAFDLPPDLAQTVRLAHDPNAPYAMIEAHRGTVGPGSPENSIPALIRSAEIGVDVIEIDIRRTRDGKLVLMHDKKLDRTTTLSGYVHKTTFAQLKKARLLDTDGGVTKLRIPTLSEALKTMRGKSLFRLDIKCEPECLNDVYAMVRDMGMMDQAVMLNRNVALSHDAGLRDHQIIVSGDRIDRIGSPANLSATDDYIGVRDFGDVLPRDLVDRFAGRTRLMAFTYDDRRAGGMGDKQSMQDPDKGWGLLIDAGVSMFLTDEPEALIAYLESRGLRRRGS